MDAIVIGGGLMGSAATFFLARRGLRVVLLERGRVGTGATVASFGNIRRSGRYLPQLPLAHHSRALWGQAQHLLGRDVEFRATGHVRLIFGDKGLADMRRFRQAAQPWGLELEEMDAADLHRRFPGLGPTAIGASFSPDDGSGNPRLISPAFAEAAVRLGAKVVEGAEVLGITPTDAGFRVETTRGSFAAAQVLNAAGAWGGRIAERFGEVVPIRAHGPQMGVTEPLPHRILPVVGVWAESGHGGYLRQVERGNIVFGGGVTRTEVDLDSGHAHYDFARLPAQLASLLPILPALAGVSVIRTWSGCEGYVADELPVMGPSATTPGLFHAFGFCGHGFQLGPGVGDVMAEMMATGRHLVPLGDFRIDRFAQAA
ncbi:FAD-binding oxidoreductase [Gemmobacter sp.]|uniref:NAD(P)/FAD-dependent oxidoreductase n=1 Tax=Gemmobacter sp. TaxID=1898957 RepID=UPI002AFF9804|nr:FAD-binding oxidoreductase [Gemmobacter sp.]